MGCRVGSFFEDSNLEYTKILGLLHYWSFDLPVTTTAALLGLSETTVIQWHKELRNVCQHWVLHNHRQIGGLGEIVEIDEALVAKRKNNV